MQYALNIGIALDRLVNAVLRGNPSETLSQRLGRAQAAGSRRACIVCRLLDLINPRHCAWSLLPGPSLGKELWDWNPK